MSINSRLKQGIRNRLGGSIEPAFNEESQTSELYIEFPGKPLLEVHVGVRVQGISLVSHECDVCVLHQEEANRCRLDRQEPNCSRVIIAVECKHYETEINLDLARSFIGLASELQVEGDCYFVSNTSSGSVAKLLATRRLKWEQNVTLSFKE